MSIKNFYKTNKEKGISVYLSVVMMAIILSIILGLTVILIGQIKSMKQVENSVIAFYGADTGVEQMLAEQDVIYNADGSIEIPLTTMNCGGKIVEYEVLQATQGQSGYEDWCLPSGDYTLCIKSVGTYQGTKRAILITM